MAPSLNREGVKAILGIFHGVNIEAIGFFLAAGTFAVPRAWVYFAIHYTATCIGAAILWRWIPEVANMRSKPQKGTKAWDWVLLGVYLAALLGVAVVGGFEVGRYARPQLGSGYMGLGLFCYVAGFVLWYWAMLVNRHFETGVRVQLDRDHQVVDAGPYRWVRHPGYLSMVIGAWAGPLIYGSVYALIPAGVAVLTIVIRTQGEDRLLRQELAGYAAFADRIRYRLIPGLW
ncbi:MAG: isoprenylcysteine carboxylmethyltransferase family protein [Candidatus Latescibacteria bacterium]|nr:isoprenylcysteine carboxylmethyltransferase family protein [Candidatus Latescibacterota bacterium]